MTKKISSTLLIALILISFSIISSNSSVYGQKENINQYSYSTNADLPTIGGLYHPTFPLTESFVPTIEKRQDSQESVTFTSRQSLEASPTTVSLQTVSTTGESPTTAPEQNRERIFIPPQSSTQEGFDIIQQQSDAGANEGVRRFIIPAAPENPDVTAQEGILQAYPPTIENPEAAQTPTQDLNPIFRTCNPDLLTPNSYLFATYEIEGDARLGKLFNDGEGQKQLQIRIFNDLLTHFLTGRISVNEADTQAFDRHPEYSQVLENDKSEKDERVEFNIEDVDTECENRVNPEQLIPPTTSLDATQGAQINPPIRQCEPTFTKATYTILGPKLSNDFDGQQDIELRIFNDLKYGQLQGELLIDGNHRETFTPTIYTECQQDTAFNIP
jgi:hypothetical protein